MAQCMTTTHGQRLHKRTYRSRAQARKIARRIGDGVQPYRCGECGSYHVGHSPRKQPERTNT